MIICTHTGIAVNENANVCVNNSVRKNFEGHAGLRTHKNIWIAGPASQLHVLTVGTSIISTNKVQWQW